ncbi:MAG: tetrathionate reductase family octaheme c-type cytochrome, partial [Deltaproteobacteria bacterium]|nr:tetrathionate reductase family octaheme c-type cytochrome [Deltaproteobacteria bacterium]
LAVGLVAALALRGGEAAPARPGGPEPRSHLDHSPFFEEPFSSGPEVTQACLVCHPDAAREVMGTAHFRWLGDEVEDPRTGQRMTIGKRNLINNFCIGIQGNEASCTRCHAGYGWEDDTFDFTVETSVDCLACHERSGQYRKGEAGRPAEGTDLLAAARSVGYPLRSNCGGCHAYGGGGLGVKHGDLDSTLDNPTEEDDVHMGRAGLLCIDCHGGHGHDIRGKAYSVSVGPEGGIGCVDCHPAAPHGDDRLNRHVQAVACQTCHIPTFARTVPTKTRWDWSKAGDDTRPDDDHAYLRIKGEFVYERDVVPEYLWFDMTMDRYLLGDPVRGDGPTAINRPRGDRSTPGARIWPFKVHRGKQPWDRRNGYLVAPVTSGPGGYWHDFDWGQAIRLGAARAGLAFSGDYGFTETEMFWPLSHMVAPADRALGCDDCHDAGGRLDWTALGYTADPMRTGGGR